MIKLKIDVLKISKPHLYKGTKGTYLDLTLMDNKDGKDKYDNDGFIVQDIGKEAREAGERGPIIGNWRNIGEKPRQESRREEPRGRKQEPDDDDLPI